MNNHNIETNFKKKIEMIEKKPKKRKRSKNNIVTLSLISLLILASLTLFSASASSEPSMETILKNSGFTNIAHEDIERFSAGTYNITLLAKFSNSHSINVLSHYSVETSNYQTIFTGSKGNTSLPQGYVVPPLSTMLIANNQFALSILSPKFRYFTEHYLNPDFPEQHSKIYVNLDNPDMFLIGFESCYGGGTDRDYNDLVFSMRLISPQIINVTRSIENPNYDQTVTITAQVTKRGYDIASIILSYQIDYGSWTNKTMKLESGSYIANIPAQQYNTTVNYKVYAADMIGKSEVSAVSSYTTDDFVSPIISNITQVPELSNSKESVKVSANVNEPSNASGVKNVKLWYTGNTTWTALKMTIENEVWTATVTEQTKGTLIILFVEASDNVGNSAKTNNFSYTTLLPDSSPIAILMYKPPVVFTDEIIDFDASTSYDPDGYIVSYSWDFGDGTTATGSIVSHSYSDNGKYLVVLKIIDKDGIEAFKAATQVVKNRSPIAELTEFKTIINKKEKTFFDASSSFDPDGEIISYKWDFGDGTTSIGKTVSHSFANSGFYTVSLTVIDNDEATNSAYVTKLVVNSLPVAFFTVRIEMANTEKIISLDASESYDPDGTIVNYTWDFDDGTTATGITTEHTYHEKGTYTVTLTVTDNDGEKDTVSAPIRIVLNQSPVALFTESTQTASSGKRIHFNGSSSYDSDGSIIKYEWDFGDKNTATGVIVEHEYEDDGVFTVTFTVTSDDFLIDSATTTIKVLNRSPVASLGKSASTVMIAETIHFDGSESYDPDGIIVYYTWDFDDGTTATGLTTEHTYHEKGTYNVTLTVTDNDGASMSAVAEITTEPTISLSIISVIGLGITTLTSTLLYGLFIQKKNNTW